MQEQYYYELAEKWLNGSITEDEKKEFLEWYNSQQEEPLIIPSSFAKSEEELKNRIFRNIRSEQRNSGKMISLNKRSFTRLAAACVFLSLCVTAFFLFLRRNNSQEQSTAVRQTPAAVIKPGGNKAVLTLANGSQIILDTVNHGLIATEQNSEVIKSGNGQLVYNVTSDNNVPVIYNTLNTPRGGQYNIVLADGTKVWLNSASSLRFPTYFKGKERVVELSGEGYFEVAKNASMPFKVKVNDMEVNVLGTHFNVMAYEDEAEIKTTLLEGAVRMKQNNEEVIIQPGQQARLDNKGKFKVLNEVNTEEVLAWKNGIFQFEETEIRAVMRQLARWYDVTIDYEPAVGGHFSGTISKTESVENVLHMLELTGAVRFAIKDKTILVRREERN